MYKEKTSHMVYDLFTITQWASSAKELLSKINLFVLCNAYTPVEEVYAEITTSFRTLPTTRDDDKTLTEK